jgi:hypothetical protein
MRYINLTFKCLAILLAAGAASCPLMAQESGRRGTEPATPSIRAARVSEAIVIDGLLTEDSWRAAESVSRFIQKDPQEGEAASEVTDVTVLYDTRHIYFGVICHDSDPAGIRATEQRRDDSLNNDDIFELIIDTFHDHRNGYLFRVNPLGTQYDATITNEGQTTNAAWDEKWEVRTRINELGWSAEIMIPFQALRFLSGDSIVWGINFHRTIRRKNEDVFWTAHNRNYRFTEVSRAGHLAGLSEIQGFTFRLKPYFTGGAGKGLVAGRQQNRRVSDVGIEDAKFMLTPRLVLDMTVNPDFAQADVDQAQINLTRFSLFFPEKREFFQEGSGVFQFGTAGASYGRPDILLFHTRAIGLSPTREEIPIRAGLKLTGKQGPLDIGLLNMQTAGSGRVPGQNFTVLRAKGNLLARSYIGAMFTRNTAGVNGAPNRAGGIDASFTFFQNLNLKGLLAKNDAAGTNEKQWAGHGKLEWNSDRLEFVLEHVNIQENFRPEMGFVARAEPNWKGVERSVVQSSFKPRPGISWIRQFQFSSSLNYVATQQGILDTREVGLGWSTDFQSGDALDFEFGRNFERLVRPLRIRGGGTVPIGNYLSNSYRLMYRAFRGRSISGNIQFETGGFYDGSRTRFKFSPQVKPSRSLSIDPEYEWSKVSLPGKRSFTTQQLNTNVNYSFSQKWLTRTTLLLNSQDRQYAANFRLNYIFRPGDDLFVIYNEVRTYGSGGQLQDRTLIVKTTFSFDH